MGFSESGHGCKMHPNQQQKQGVCPSCLRERLSRLCSSTSYNEASNSRVAPYSPPADDNSTSPAQHCISHQRKGSGVIGIMGISSSFMAKVGTNHGLKKSSSIAFVPRKLDDEDVKNGKKMMIKKKKKGFWSKLLHLKGKKDVLKHSISMRI